MANCRNGPKPRSKKRSAVSPPPIRRHAGNCSTSTRSRCSSPWCCRRRRPTPALFALADTPEQMAKLGEAKVRDLIKTIGLYRTKAKNVIGLSQLLFEKHGGKVPHDREALEALPGVGRKTANVVLNIAFGEPTIAVDTHIFRVGNRTGLAVGKTPLDVEMKLLEVVPEKYRLHAHHWLILFGRYTCIARRPLCETCIIADLCRWPGKTVNAPAAI